MEGESGVTRSIIDESHSSDIQRDEIGGESGVTRSIIDELHSWDIQGDQMEGESGVTPTIVEELLSSDIQEIKWRVKLVLLEVSLMNFIVQISRRQNGSRNWCYSKYH